MSEIVKNEIVKNENELVLPENKYEEAIGMISSSGFLPRIQLMSGRNEIVAQGKFPTGTYALIIGQTYEELGKEFHALVCAWRPIALNTKAGEKHNEVIAYYEHKSPEFINVMQMADKVKDSGCLYGPQYLLWIPSVKTFALYLMGNKSARREANMVNRLLKSWATFRVQWIESQKYPGWHAPQVVPCSVQFENPKQEALDIEALKFLNPPKVEVVKEEVAAEAGVNRDR